MNQRPAGRPSSSEQIIKDIKRRTRKQYGAEDATVWGGFRPMTPNGQPLVGATGVRGLFLNTGHGMLGWTLACATGYNVAQAH